MSDIITRALPGGVTTVLEPIGGVRSVAIEWRVPAGAASDPVDRQGQSAALAELIFRGAGGLDSRRHSDALDRLGVQRAAQPTTYHLHLDATLMGDRLSEALPLVASMIRTPALEDDAVDAVASLCRQTLDGLEDDPQHLAMIRLREQHLPAPFDRHGYGEASVLESLSGGELREAWARRFVPGGSIIAVAGAFDPARIEQQLASELEDWTGTCVEPEEVAPPKRGYRHIGLDSSQVHLSLAYDAPAEPDESSVLERLATTVLGGSTSGRLFTEVRQKRSLCYSVGASYRAGRDTGFVSLYSGTTPDRAQETLDVCVAEIERLRDGVERAEFERAQVGLKSRLVMRGESVPARAAALASDYFRLGRAQTLDEVAAAIDAVTLDGLNAYLARREFGAFTVVSIGPSPLIVPAAERSAVN